MGLWGFIKALFGKDEKDNRMLYNPIHPVLPPMGSWEQRRKLMSDRDHWSKLKRDVDNEFETARVVRSRYG